MPLFMRTYLGVPKSSLAALVVRVNHLELIACVYFEYFIRHLAMEHNSRKLQNCSPFGRDISSASSCCLCKIHNALPEDGSCMFELGGLLSRVFDGRIYGCAEHLY